MNSRFRSTPSSRLKHINDSEIRQRIVRSNGSRENSMNRKQPRAYLFPAIFRALTVFLSFFLLGTAVFAQELSWIKAAGGTNGDRGRGIAVDSAGNSYVTGYFSGTATFSTSPLVQLTSAGSFDVFIAKYDSNGSLVWAKSAGGIGNDQGGGIAVDSTGNSYVTGAFEGTATFSTSPLVQLTASGPDVFIAKYDTDGALVWAKRAGGSGVDESLGIAVDSVGNSYVTGYVSGTATFSTSPLVQLTSTGSFDVFIAKYDSSGSLVWAKSAGGTNADKALGIASPGWGQV